MTKQECENALKSEMGDICDISYVKSFEGGFLFSVKSKDSSMVSGGTYAAANSSTGRKGFSVIEEDAIKFCLA